MANSTYSNEKKNKDIQKNNNLIDWQEKYEEAKQTYQPEIDEIEDNREAYEGTRKIRSSDGSISDKQSSNVRKVCFELVEAQVNTNIPLPKVVSKDGYEEQSVVIEMYLKYDIDRINIEELNDEQSRSTITDGASIFYLEWDNTAGSRQSNGEIYLQNIDSKQVIPQQNVSKIDKMDYMFVEFQQTRMYIKEKYGVLVENEVSEDTENEDLLTHIFCYYKNKDGKIGLLSYVGDTIVMDFEDYYSRKQEKCVKCDTIKNPLENKCKCGGRKFKTENKEKEEITIQKPIVNPVSGEVTFVDEIIEVEHYVPDFFPIVIVKNVSRTNKFLGASDVTYIKDQQNDLSIYGSKIKEKMLKGGSILIKPENLKFEASNDELKILNVKNPSQKAMIDVKNLQPDISKDLNMLDVNYVIARQTLGITDSFQGRQDKTATSGKAKEIAAAQAAGRLVSKRKMKEFAFSQLYEKMFKFNLAYIDEPRTYTQVNDKGQLEYKVFDKRDFLLIDENGDYFYNDEFSFSTDVSSTLSNNREAMWQETRMNFTSGTYGTPDDIGTLIMFWTTMNNLHYPGAKQALNYLQTRKTEQEGIRQQELIANNIQTSNVQNIQQRNQLDKLDLENKISNLQNTQLPPQQNIGG